MYRPLSTVPLPAAAQASLLESGFLYCEDIVSHRGVTSEAQNILHRWHLHSNDSWFKLTSPPSTSNALDVWQDECSSPGIVTWSKELDKMLGGGVSLQAITELCGAPGSGKTQICLQLCVDVQIPEHLGGIDGEAVFIDTASNFSPQRIRDMADACCQHCQLLVESQRGNQPADFRIFEPNSVLNGIHYISVHGITELLAAIKLLRQVLEKHPKIKLIVIDSLAFPFHCGDTCSTIDRTSYLYRILSDLQQFAEQKRLAVVVTNQLTTRITKPVGTKSELAPALGESLGHRVNQRILLGRTTTNSIAAILLKGNGQSSLTAKFQILKQGIRDCE